MPGTLALRPTVSPEGSRVDVFGDADANEPVRIAVPVRMHVSFAELLTLLLFTPGVNLECAELLDDDAVRDAVQFALISTDLFTLDHRTRRTMAIYRGEALGSEVPPAAYVANVAAAITRVFGVSA